MVDDRREEWEKAIPDDNPFAQAMAKGWGASETAPTRLNAPASGYERAKDSGNLTNTFHNRKLTRKGSIFDASEEEWESGRGAPAHLQGSLGRRTSMVASQVRNF